MKQNGQMEKIMALMNNEEAVENLQDCRNQEETIQSLREYGVEMDPADLRKLYSQGKLGEISENDLNDITGGSWWSDFFERLFGWRRKENYDDIHGMAQELCNRQD